MQIILALALSRSLGLEVKYRLSFAIIMSVGTQLYIPYTCMYIYMIREVLLVQCLVRMYVSVSTGVWLHVGAPKYFGGSKSLVHCREVVSFSEVANV